MIITREPIDEEFIYGTRLMEKLKEKFHFQCQSLTVNAAFAHQVAKFVPIDPDFPESRIQYILQDIGASFILTDSSYTNKLDLVAKGLDQPLQILELDQSEQEIDRESKSKLLPVSGPESVCYVMYTSGTTGRPKVY